jgi:hypothetical protein
MLDLIKGHDNKVILEGSLCVFDLFYSDYISKIIFSTIIATTFSKFFFPAISIG